MSKKFISWRRVSTFRQGKSGLGLSAQKEIINYFINRECGTLIADYEECYTGKDLNGCIELKKAICHAKSENAILIIAKTDRFRNTIEALQIYEKMGDGNIMFCDLPHTDKFTLTLFFALAEREALIVSIRTKQALAVKKKQGAKLGASSEKYKQTFYSKSMEEIKEMYNKRGNLKHEHFLESRDIKAFVRIIKNEFPDHTTNDDIHKWEWRGINCKHMHKPKMLQMIHDYKAIDSNLFRKFDGTKYDETRLQSLMYSLKRSLNA